MDGIITQMVGTSPMLAVLCYFLWVVYQDAKADRKQAADERQRMLDHLDSLDKSLSALVTAIENNNTLRRRGRSEPIDMPGRGF